MSKKQKRQYFFLYTILFLAIAAAVYSAFLDRTFIKSGDGILQHYRAVVYYRNWLRQIIQRLFSEHRLVIPEWDFSIGFGANILTTFHYYAIGDPLNLLSVFVPERHMITFYNVMILVRSYLAGAIFSGFCFYKKKDNPYGILAGAFTYVFSHFMIMIGMRHPFFGNPLIYFPLVIWGAEKILNREKPYLFIFSVCLSAVSNFYFFYMIALLTAGYVLVRCGCIYGWKNRKEGLWMILRVAFFAVVGVCLSACLFFPVIWAFLHDHRGEAKPVVSLLYNRNYYKRLPSAYIGYISAGHFCYMGYGVPAFFAAILLFVGKERKQYGKNLKAVYLFGSMLLLFPAAAYALNGFAYILNRWIWAYGLLAAYVLCAVWSDLFRLRRGDIVWMTLLALGLLFMMGSVRYTWPIFAGVLLICGIFALAREKMHDKKWVRAGQIGMLVCVAANLIWNGNILFRTSKIAEDFLTEESARSRHENTPDPVVQKLMEEHPEFFRYGGQALVTNSAVNAGTRSLSSYWSVSNGNVSDFLKRTQTNVFRFYRFTGLDDRSGLTALAGCRYYLCPSGKTQKLPFGFRFLKTRDGYDVYENEYALPLGYTYDASMTLEQAEELNGVQQEEAMLQNVILEEPVAGYPENTPVLHGSELEYRMVSTDENVQIQENAIKVLKANSSVVLQVTDQTGAGEKYLCLSGYDCQASAQQVYVGVAARMADGSTDSTSFYFESDESQWPTNRDTYAVNLGCSESGVEEITLTFPKKGLYSFDRLYVWSQPVDSYAENIRALREDVLENEEIGANTVKGTIDLAREKILLLNIPYDGGWKAYVDGKEQDILKANYMFSALPLSAGHHEIVLRYCTPMRNVGTAVSLCGLLLLFGIILWKRRPVSEADGAMK